MLTSMTPLHDGRTVAIRQAREADAGDLQAFVRGLSWQSRLERFFVAIPELGPRQLDRLLSGHGLSLLARDGQGRVVAHAQYALSDGDAEFAVVVADDWHGAGLGERLVSMLAAHAARSGARTLGGITRVQNRPMRGLAGKLGFSFAPDADPGLVRLEMPLAGA